MTASTYQVTVSAAEPALTILKRETGLSTTALKQAAMFGCIWWQQLGRKPQRLRRLKKIISEGEQLHGYIDPDIIRQSITPAICVADEGAYSIWLKPRGMFSQGTKWGDANSISRFVQTSLDRPTWLVHRLDRMTAGLMILSHQKALVAKFEQDFRDNTINKQYLALTTGHLEPAERLIDVAIDERSARTEIMACHYDAEADISLVTLKIHTGRKHQIRRHLAGVGVPIIGDRLYGQNADEQADLQLVAWRLGFTDPLTTEPRQWQLSREQLLALFLPSAAGLVSQAVDQELTE